MKIVEIAEIIRKQTGCDPHLAFIAATDIKIAEIKERPYGRK